MANLRARGSSFAAIGRDLGISRTAVMVAMIRRYRSVEAAIAAKLEMHPGEIWPERYPDFVAAKSTTGKKAKQ